MSGRFQPLMGADSIDATTSYRVPLRSLDSDHTFERHIRVLGPIDLGHQMDQLRVEFPGYALGTPREVPA